MPARKLIQFLEDNQTPYTTIHHSPTHTATDAAHSAHLKAAQLAKTVVLNADNRLLMMVLPANLRVDLPSLKSAVGAAKLELPSEQEFTALFPSCEPGALPPFGNLYGMDVYCAEQLADEDQLIFSAGSHSELILMKFHDYRRLVNPTLIASGTVPPRMHEDKHLDRL